MKINELHDVSKSVSTAKLFKGEGTIISLRILKGNELKDHSSQVAAILICVIGHAIYITGDNQSTVLNPGDYVHIEALKVHKVVAMEDSQLLLIK